MQFATPAAVEAVLTLDRSFEYGVLALDSDLTIDGAEVATAELRYLGWGRDRLMLSTGGPATFLLLGGEPLAEQLLMWWNFVGRSHEDIVEARNDWESGSTRFGAVVGDPAEPLRAPILPSTRMQPRPGRRPTAD